MRTTAIRGTAAAVLLSATVLGLAGCVNAEKSAPAGAGDSVSYGAPPSSATETTTAAAGSSGASTAQTADGHNAADVTFVKQALLLRQQAIAMSTLAGTSSTNAQVKALATQLKNDAVPSVATMTDWLGQWGQAVPTAATDQAPGVLTSTQLSQLSAAGGTAFDMHWLQYMRANLQAAKDAVTTEQSHGSFPQAKQLAQQWASTVQPELTKANGIS